MQDKNDESIIQKQVASNEAQKAPQDGKDKRRRRKAAPNNGEVIAKQAPAKLECPGCHGSFPDLQKHMRRCCPEQMQRSNDREAVSAHRKAMSPDDWLDEDEVRAAAAASIQAITDPLHRQVLELRFGLDRNGQRRSPTEVGQVLGGKYAKNGQTAQVLIRTALNSIPLVADDPTNLQVLYEDAAVVAVAKPPYLRTTPVHRFCGKSLTSQLVGHMQALGITSPPYIVHRLDQGTSGVFLCAKTKQSAAYLQQHWHGTDCSKVYLAIVHIGDSARINACGESIIVDAPIARAEDLADRVDRMVDPEGQSAKTRLEMLARGPKAALLSCTLLESGRTHQIRVHASHSGMPLVGDGLYGGEEGEMAGIGRVALHCWRLRVLNPDTGFPLEIIAPLPEDMALCCAAHGIEWTSDGERQN